MLSTVDLERLIAEKRREIEMEKSALGLSPPITESAHTRVEDLEPDDSDTPRPRRRVIVSVPKETADIGDTAFQKRSEQRKTEKEFQEEIPAGLERYIRRYLGLPVMLKAGEFSPNNPILREERTSGDALLGLGEYERRRNTLRKIRQQQYREYLDQQAKKKQEEKERAEKLRRESEEKERQKEEERERLRQELKQDTPTQEQRRASVCFVTNVDKAPSGPKSRVETGVQVGVTKPLSVAVQTDDTELYGPSHQSVNKLTTAERELSPRCADAERSRDGGGDTQRYDGDTQRYDGDTQRYGSDSRAAWDQQRDHWGDQHRSKYANEMVERCHDRGDTQQYGGETQRYGSDSRAAWDQQRDHLGDQHRSGHTHEMVERCHDRGDTQQYGGETQRYGSDSRAAWDQQRDHLGDQHRSGHTHEGLVERGRDGGDTQRYDGDTQRYGSDSRAAWDQQRDHLGDQHRSGHTHDNPMESTPPRPARSKVGDLRHSYMPSILDAEAIRMRNLQAEKEALERRQSYQQELKRQIEEQQRIREERKNREKLLEQAEMRRLEEQLQMLRVATERERWKQRDIGCRMKSNTTAYEKKRNSLQRDIDYAQQKLRTKTLPDETKRLPTSRSENSISKLPFYYPKDEISLKKNPPYSTNIPDNSIFSPAYDVDSYLRKNLNPSKENLFSNRLDTISSVGNNEYSYEGDHDEKISEGIHKMDNLFARVESNSGGKGFEIFESNTDPKGFERFESNAEGKLLVERAQIHEPPKDKNIEKPHYEPSVVRKLDNNIETRDETPIPVLRHSPKVQNVDINEDLSDKMRLVEDKWKVPAVQKNILKTVPSEEGKSVSILTQLGSIRRQLQLEQMRLDNMKGTGK